MPYTRWWHSLLISVSLATWALAQPLYGFVTDNDALDGATGSTILLFMVTFHALPVLVLFLADRAIIRLWGARLILRLYRTAFFVLAALVFLRLSQRNGDLSSITSIAPALKLILIVVILAVLIAFVLRFYRQVSLLFILLSGASAILAVVFASQIGLLGDAWTRDSVQAQTIQPAGVSQQTPVFFVVFDALGGDILLDQERIDQSDFPQFSALGSDSAVFTNASTNYFFSTESISAMMTGKFLSGGMDSEPRPSGLLSDTVFGILADNGYQVQLQNWVFLCEETPGIVCLENDAATRGDIPLAAWDFGLWFSPQRVTRVVRSLVLDILPTGATRHIPVSPIHRDFRSTWDTFLSSVSAEDSLGKAYFVRILLPHHPFEYDRSGNRIFSVVQESYDIPKLAEGYREQVMYVDSLLGEMVAKLKSEGLYDRSVVIVTGDHGPRFIGLGRQYTALVNGQAFPEEMPEIIPRVTLIIHGPGIQPQVSGVDYQHVDLVPTVLDILELPQPSGLDGHSAFAPQRPSRDKVFSVPAEGFIGKAGDDEIIYLYDEASARWHKTEP